MERQSVAIAVLILLTCSHLGRSQVGIPPNIEGSLARQSFIQVPLSKFQWEELRSLANEWLQRKPRVFERMVIVTERNSFLNLTLPRPSHPEFDYAAREMQAPLPVAAEVLRFCGGAVLRARLPGGVRSEVLEGSNPLSINVDGVEALIRYALLTYRTDDPSLWIRLYVSLSRPPLKAGRVEAVKNELERCFESLPGSATIRVDDWFFESSWYPWPNPFLPDQDMPSYDEFRRAHSYFCSLGQSDCIDFGIMFPRLGNYIRVCRRSQS